jgi:hypothetical protein
MNGKKANLTHLFIPNKIISFTDEGKEDKKVSANYKGRYIDGTIKGPGDYIPGYSLNIYDVNNRGGKRKSRRRKTKRSKKSKKSAKRRR